MKTDFWFKLFLKAVIYFIFAYFIYLLGLITFQYAAVSDEVAFLNIKQDEIKLTHYKIVFYGHVFSSIFVIIAGFFQFSGTIRKGYTFLHRFFGKIYIFLILLVAAPTGLVMAYHANGGIISKISFAILSILWFYFTLKALISIQNKKFEKHRNFMIRSYALTLSAVSLRLFKYWIVIIFELPPMDTYKIVSVLGWTVNLLIAELIISKIKNVK